jgi:hypothetical protein
MGKKGKEQNFSVKNFTGRVYDFLLLGLDAFSLAGMRCTIGAGENFS